METRGGSSRQTGSVSSRVDRQCFQQGRPAPTHAAVLGLRLPRCRCCHNQLWRRPSSLPRACSNAAAAPLGSNAATTLRSAAAAMPLGFLHRREKYMAPTRGKSSRKKLNLSRPHLNPACSAQRRPFPTALRLAGGKTWEHEPSPSSREATASLSLLFQ